MPWELAMRDRSPRFALLAVVAVCVAVGASCHRLLYERDPSFCCLSEAECATGGAPSGMTFPCTQPGDVCDVEHNSCVPDPTIIKCNTPDDCAAADPKRPACIDGHCVACGDDTHQCPATAPECSPSYVCEACTDGHSCSRFPGAP